MCLHVDYFFLDRSPCAYTTLTCFQLVSFWLLVRGVIWFIFYWLRGLEIVITTELAKVGQTYYRFLIKQLLFSLICFRNRFVFLYGLSLFRYFFNFLVFTRNNCRDSFLHLDVSLSSYLYRFRRLFRWHAFLFLFWLVFW